MPDIPVLLAAATLLVWVAATVSLARGARRLTSIADVTPAPPAQLPTASVVVAARDEARHIRDAMRTLFELDHPALEIIAVDDRSSDGTGAILDALATEDPRLTVEHVTTLPEGWLGKNHALHQGAARARGEFVLFTDADIYLAPDVLRRAVTLMQTERLDHLVVGPLTIGGSAPMRALLCTFAVLFTLGTRPWRAAEPGRPEHVGIGAFNLVRASALRQIGGLTAVRLRPDDDVKLGKVIKAAGLRQRFVRGEGAVKVEWYRTAAEMVRGLEKNSFPFLDYSVPRTLLASVALALLGVWPWIALFVVDGAVWWLNLAVVCLSSALVAGAAQQSLHLTRWYGVTLPFGVMLMIVTLLNSMVRTLAQGGVVWRGTLYPLAALRANRV